MIRVVVTFVCLMVSINCSSAGGNNEEPEERTVLRASNLTILDVRNTGNASDLDASFTVANAAQTNEIEESARWISSHGKA